MLTAPPPLFGLEEYSKPHNFCSFQVKKNVKISRAFGVHFIHNYIPYRKGMSQETQEEAADEEDRSTSWQETGG